MNKQDILNSSMQEILSMIEKGSTTYEIAERFNSTSGTVWYFLNKNGIYTKHKRENLHYKKDYIEQVLKLWNENNSCYSIAKTLNLSRGTVEGWLREEGCDLSRHDRMDRNKPQRKEQQQEIIRLFVEENLSCEEIGRRLNFAGNNISTFLRKLGYDTSFNSYNVDEDFFETIDTEAKAYFLGLLCSDGSVGKRSVRISLQERDKDILDKFIYYIGYEGELHFKRAREDGHQNQYLLCISRKKIVEDLIKLGCVHNKSHLLTFPTQQQVPDELLPHYLRGFSDGDGSVRRVNNNSCSCNIIGTDLFIEGLSKWLEGHNIYHSIYNCANCSNHSKLQIGRTSEAIKFRDIIYKDAIIYLQRKYYKFYNISTPEESLCSV